MSKRRSPTGSRSTASTQRCRAASSIPTAFTARCIRRSAVWTRSSISARSASSWTIFPTATMFSATSMTCSAPCRAASRTTLPRPSPTATRACIRPSSARRESCSRCRSAPGRCTASANTASPRTGSTNPAARASAPEMRRSSPGSAACSKRSRTPTRRTSFTISKWTCLTMRFSYSRRRATW